MSQFRLFFLIVLMFMSSRVVVSAQSANGSEGKDFWLCVPPNEVVNGPPRLALELYIAAGKKTTVRIESADGTFVRQVNVDSMSTKTVKIPWAFELREVEEVTNLSLHVYSLDGNKFTAYLLSARQVTADGYMALPTNVLGTDYYHLCYPDWFDFGEKRGSGFAIVATEDGTKVDIFLKNGMGFPVTEKGTTGTPNGSTLTKSITLLKGQAYTIRGDGALPGANDFSGSRVKSDKPIAFWSYHMRTTLPNSAFSRDYMVEMIPPVQSWGKKYVSWQFKTGASNRGDYIRVIASQPNTRVDVVSYDIVTKEKIAAYNAQIQKAGDFWEPVQLQVGAPGVRGVCSYTADKPIMVMHYACSGDHYGSNVFDPFMTWVTPAEQFLKSTVFQTPTQEDFINNFFNIVAIGDSTDPSQRVLKTIKMDKQFLYQMEPSFLSNRIPGTNFYVASPRVTGGAHKLSGQAKFGGYIYGFGIANSYGWPAASAFNDISVTDTLPPVILSRDSLCGDYFFTAIERRDSAARKNPFTGVDGEEQKDLGIVAIEFVEDANYNYVIKSDTLSPPVKGKVVSYSLEVIDRSENAYARFYITDKAGNAVEDSVYYNAPTIKITPKSPISFGRVRVGTPKIIPVTVTNTGLDTMSITKTYLAFGLNYRITRNLIPPDPTVLLDPAQPQTASSVLVIEYTPTREYPALSVDTSKQYDFDTLYIETGCKPIKVILTGRGVMPHIAVEDFDAGTLPLGAKICFDQLNGRGLEIKNDGTEDLIVSDLLGFSSPFYLSTPLVPALPFTVPAGGSVRLVTPCYEALKEETTEQDVTFVNNGAIGDSISRWTGIGTKSQVLITSYDWGKQRLKMPVGGGVVYIVNRGTTDAILTNVDIRDKVTGNFAINKISVNTGNFNTSSQILRGKIDTVKVELTFTGQVETDAAFTQVVDAVRATFTNEGEIFGKLTGIPILPKINGLDYDFGLVTTGVTMTTDTAARAYNMSETADLKISEVRFATPNDPTAGAFYLDLTSFMETLVKLKTGGNYSALKLPVSFTPPNSGIYRTLVEFVHDGQEGDTLTRSVEQIVITGHSGTFSIDARGHDFGSSISCDPVDGFIEIDNPNDIPLDITSLTLAKGTNFSIVSQTTPFTIPLKTSGYRVAVRFTPDNSATTFEDTVAIGNSINPALKVVLRGATFQTNMDLNINNQFPIIGSSRAPGERVNYPIGATCNNWKDSKVTGMTIYLSAKKGRLDPISVDRGAAVDGSWNFTLSSASPTTNITHYVIDGTSSTNTPIGADGQVCMLTMRTMLFDGNESDVVITIDSVSAKSRDYCMTTAGNSTLITLESCAYGIRKLKSLDGIQPFSFSDVSPNPATSSFKISYGISYTAPTKVELINMTTGQVINLVDSEQDMGSYEIDVQSDKLGSGAYSVRVSSGLFIETRSVVIAK